MRHLSLFEFALSQYSGPDYLGAWYRLKSPIVCKLLYTLSSQVSLGRLWLFLPLYKEVGLFR